MACEKISRTEPSIIEWRVRLVLCGQSKATQNKDYQQPSDDLFIIGSALGLLLTHNLKAPRAKHALHLARIGGSALKELAHRLHRKDALLCSAN